MDKKVSKQDNSLSQNNKSLKQEQDFVDKELYADLTILPGDATDYIMEYSENGDTIKDYGNHSEKIRKFMRELPRPESKYETGYNHIPLFYRWMNLRLDDLKNILHEWFKMEKIDNDHHNIFFTSQPDVVLLHAIECLEENLTENNNKRIGVIFAIKPSLLIPYTIDSKWGWTFTVDKSIPHEVVLQGDIYVFNHKNNSMDKIDLSLSEQKSEK